MAKRMVLMLVVMGVIIAALGLGKFRQIKKASAQGSFQPPPESVTTIVARQEEWPATVNAIGTVTPVQGVTVSADLPGIVEKITFESGRSVRAGEVLVKLDTSQEEAQMAAAEARRELTRLDLDRMRGLREQGIVSQADYDRAVAESAQEVAAVGEIRATIERKTIRAPFSGILGIRRVNLGQYLAGGDPIVPLQSLHPIYVSFSVPQQEVGNLRLGGQVQVTAKGAAGVESTASMGKITAVNSIVDEATRNVEVQAILDNRGGKLRPGMFVEAGILLGEGRAVVALPASSISYAPFGDSVFIVEDVKGPDGKSYRGVRQQFVKVGGARGDQVAVVSGVKPGEEVVTSAVFKLRNGAAVVVNNSIQPSNAAAPRPEDS